jgi:hypothetical protein
MYPHNNISQTINDLSFIDYGSSSGKWRANKKIKIDPVSFYQSGFILSGKDYFKKSFGSNSDNRFDDFLVEFYGTGNNYEVDFTKNEQSNLSIERTGNSNGGFLINYRGYPTSFSETGATGFYSFNFNNTGISPVNLFGQGNAKLVYSDARAKTSSGYFGSGLFIDNQLSYTGMNNIIVSAYDNQFNKSFNLDSFTLDFLLKMTGTTGLNMSFMATRTMTGLNYPSINHTNSLIFHQEFSASFEKYYIISLYHNYNARLRFTTSGNDWDHFCITSNRVGSNHYFSGYKNGILVATYTALTGSFNYGASLPISGLDIAGYSFNGRNNSAKFLDEIRMWSGAKSSGEINNLKFKELQSDPFLYNDPNLLYHISFDTIYTQNKKIQFYKNGNLLQTNTINNIYTGYLDYSKINITGNLEFDEFRFWSGSKTNNEISGYAKSGIDLDKISNYQNSGLYSYPLI